MNAQPASNRSASNRFTTIVMLVVAFCAAAAIGAWESISPSPTEAVEQRSAFVQSGGATSDVDPSVPDASSALSHARAPSAPELTATTF